MQDDRISKGRHAKLGNAVAHTYGERAAKEKGWRCRQCGHWHSDKLTVSDHYKLQPECQIINKEFKMPISLTWDELIIGRYYWFRSSPKAFDIRRVLLCEEYQGVVCLRGIRQEFTREVIEKQMKHGGELRACNEPREWN